MKNESPSQFQQRIVDEYFDSLVRYAEARLGRHRRIVDGEDIALSALGSFFDRYGTESRREIAEADSLWPLIATITQRKALNHVRRETQLKRGRGRVRGDSVFADAPHRGLDEHADSEATPDAIAQSIEVVHSLLSELSPELAEIASRKLEGFTNPEIASELGSSVATIERRLKLIRSVWKQHVN